MLAANLLELGQGMPPGKRKGKTVLIHKQQVAINLIATGSTTEEAAEVLNITRSIINKWKKESPAFSERLKGITDGLKV